MCLENADPAETLIHHRQINANNCTTTLRLVEYSEPAMKVVNTVHQVKPLFYELNGERSSFFFQRLVRFTTNAIVFNHTMYNVTGPTEHDLYQLLSIFF